MSARALVVWAIAAGAALAAGSACVASDSSRCGNDLVCPSGMLCAPSGDVCVDADLVTSCAGSDDGEVCRVAGYPPATCLAGICQASRCGDGRVSGAEECDGEVPQGQTCRTHGFYDEVGLRCGPDCKLDTSSCVGRCGDGVVNGREQCDGAELGGATCFTAGFYAEKGLACKADCSFDVSACTGGRCGDGILNGLEQCDGTQFNRSCDTLGFAGAMSGLACTSNCLFSNASCLCWGGHRCRAKSFRCDCGKLGGCGCAATK
ncbi:MAG TPA: hypothetical protein VKB80_13950 [Kofleriaceae bacterium]|nr:hypothetical protein [Kofleriaceae bacterium]